MLNSVQVEQENVWKFVRQIRKSFLSQLKDPICQSDVPLLYDSYIKDNNDDVEKKIKIGITTNNKTQRDY